MSGTKSWQLTSRTDNLILSRVLYWCDDFQPFRHREWRFNREAVAAAPPSLRAHPGKSVSMKSAGSAKPNRRAGTKMTQNLKRFLSYLADSTSPYERLAF